jgi:hypothetical protein
MCYACKAKFSSLAPDNRIFYFKSAAAIIKLSEVFLWETKV